MRAFATALAVVGLGGFSVVGCSSSPAADGGTTTGGVASGTSTGGTTTTGGTTGGGGLAPGSACTGNSQCNSGVCGLDGTGNCCSNACSTTDAICGATACDNTGACTYPANATSCGTNVCSGNMLTASDCDGNGNCAVGTPYACPGNLICASATSCLSTCAHDTDCANGYFCSSGTCTMMLSNGASCSANADCVSNLCGLAGTGRCCASACDTTDLVCGATACDDTGACSYPSNSTSCAPPVCAGNTLTISDCDGAGTCVAAQPAVCASNLNCADDRMSCLTSCTTSTDCVSGFWCSNSACVPVLQPGYPCTENDSCNSGVCGLNGSGNCCYASCTTGDPTCGATACDSNGLCSYPSVGTSCGPTSCIGSSLSSSSCNGDGTCVASNTACANNLLCNDTETACNTTCTLNTDCAGTNANFCDTSTGACCAAMTAGGTLNVDNSGGSDANACCGYGSAGACQTLTHAMQLITAANVLVPGSTITINATISSGQQDWTVETYPVSLGWGVTLSAQGLYFNDVNGAPEIFDVALQNGEPAGNMVTIEGGFFNAMAVGSDSNANVTTDAVAINVEPNETLNASWLNVYEGSGNVGVKVQTGATLVLDTLCTGGNGLQLGGELPNFNGTPASGTGIYCQGTIDDSTGCAYPGVTGQGQNVSIDAEDGCSVNLIEGPTFGWPTNGFYTDGQGDGCSFLPGPEDNNGVIANGNANVSLSNVTVTCMTGSGIESTNSASEAATPTVSLSNAFIANCSASGVYVTAGTVTVPSGTIQYNFIGIDMEDDGFDTPSVVLNDTFGDLNTTITCNSNQEVGGTGNPGIDVYNNSTGSVNADWVNWDFWFQPNGDANSLWWPDYYQCDNSFTCTCEAVDSTSTAQCMNSNGAGGDGMNFVMGLGSGTTQLGTWSLGLQTQNDGFGTGACE